MSNLDALRGKLERAKEVRDRVAKEVVHRQAHYDAHGQAHPDSFVAVQDNLLVLNMIVLIAEAIVDA